MPSEASEARVRKILARLKILQAEDELLRDELFSIVYDMPLNGSRHDFQSYDPLPDYEADAANEYLRRAGG